jgi:hypothetical protein
MGNRLLAFFVCLIAGAGSHAQILPKPGAKLNYTQVMFEYEKVKGAAQYLVQLAEDTPGATFDHYLIAQKDSSTASMISGLEFGKKYKWRYAGITGPGPLVWHGPYHFGIGEDTLLKLKLLDLNVTVNDTANTGGLIANDATHTITDRAGRPVWYVPDVKWYFILNKITTDVRDTDNKVRQLDMDPRFTFLKLTPYGTITYMTNFRLVESDLDGNVLWQKYYCHAPSELGENAYNHAFMRMADGHYMTLGNEMLRHIPPYLNSAGQKKYALKDTLGGIVYARVEFGTVLEYDKKGDLVWSWNSEDYFDRYGSADAASLELVAHINALSTDRNNEFVYVGFRDISRIIKIQKSTGRVIDSWGEPCPGGIGPMHTLDIHAQHNADILDDGTVLVFNNNNYPGTDSIPSVVIFSQGPGEDGKVVWKYAYYLDSATRRRDRLGGSAQQLRNGNILVCTGTANHIFEVTRDKKIVWQAVIQPNTISGYNYFFRLYSAYYVSSLYPCYFTFQTDKDTLTKASPQFSIRIFNNGSEDDAYDVKLSSASGAVVMEFPTGTIRHGRSVTIPIIPGLLLTGGDKIKITISSKTNPDLQRKSEVVISE